jgi:hypothetical protein
MGLIDAIKKVFTRKKKPVPTPPIILLPENVPEDPLETYKASKAAELTDEIERLRVLEVESVSDSLRGKYRARRESLELFRSCL